MTLSKRTVISQIECTANGILQIRLEAQIVDDGAVLASHPHRTSIEPGVPVDRQMDAVNSGLAGLGYPGLDRAGRERIKRIAGVEHTPEVIAAHKKRMAEVIAARPTS